MRATRCRTKRPRGALLHPGTGLGFVMCRIGGRLGTSHASEEGAVVEIPLFSNFGSNSGATGGPCQVGSLTGAVAS
jgi:hypothetical protein